MTSSQVTTSAQMANAIRALSMDAVQKANSGHPGMPMGMADVATALFTRHLKFDPKNPQWPDRDRFVLSAGHGSMLLYSLLYLTGYEDITIDEIKNFRQLGSRTAGHPEVGEAGGIETTTGPLGQGIANAVGMAMAERLLAGQYGADLVDHYTYAIAGDGCLMEGISHEAASLAGHQKLGKLVVLFDDNAITIDGPTSLSVSDDQIKRFDAYGWQTLEVDGHDQDAVSAAIDAAKADPRPSLIACKTEIGFGSPNKGGKSSSHGAPLGDDEIALVREKLDWPHAPFEVPGEIMDAWRAAGARGQDTSKAWAERHGASVQKDAFDAAISGDLPEAAGAAIDTLKKSMSAEAPKIATRVCSQKTIEALTPVLPSFFGGSADLTGSNNTKAGDQSGYTADNAEGTYVYYGVREHGMAAAMNGMALHGGVIPYGGTFLVFTDYCRPSIRLSALMKQRVVYVMTHDSIGLGEDGPTHQPVEHLAALRVIPNLNVYRPADIVETAECWQAALENQSTPSVIALSRQGLPTLRTEHVADNLSARGGYVLTESEGGKRDVTLISTGSELHLAVEARAQLAEDGIDAVVISMPCLDTFLAQDKSYRSEVLGGDTPRIVVEAGMRQSWDRLLRDDDHFIGMDSFGASAPAPALYEHFGITTGAIVAMSRQSLGRT